MLDINHLVLVLASKLTWCLCRWSKLTWFQCGGCNLTRFQCRHEIDVWVVEIDLISVQGSELTYFFVFVENDLFLVSGSNLTRFLCRVRWGKDRSITQPRVSLTTFSLPWNGGIFGTYRLTGLRIRSYVPTRTLIQILGIFDPNPGDSGIHVYYKTHAQAFLLKEMFEVGFELMSCRRRQVL